MGVPEMQPEHGVAPQMNYLPAASAVPVGVLNAVMTAAVSSPGLSLDEASIASIDGYKYDDLIPFDALVSYDTVDYKFLGVYGTTTGVPQMKGV